MYLQSVPSGLRSLATTEPGTTVVIRSLLSDWTRAYLGAHRVGMHDHLWFHGTEREGVVVETEAGMRILLPWEHAGAVQVEWLTSPGAAPDTGMFAERGELWRG
jgi:hypothetical protein